VAPQIRELYQDKVLVHGDFSNRNIIVKREGHGWVVTGFLDWESAFSGSPLWDVAALYVLKGSRDHVGSRIFRGAFVRVEGRCRRIGVCSPGH